MPESTDSSAPRHLESGRGSDVDLGRALALVRYLRAGCPWDARQTSRSLRPYLLEEAYETAAAIDSGDDAALLEELGDLLLNLAFQIAIAEERGSFDATDVIEKLEQKMRARHPHVYGDAEQPPDWERLKAEERLRHRDPGGAFSGVAAGLEPLDRALRIQQRAAACHFDWPDANGALDKVEEEAGELRDAWRGTAAGRRRPPPRGAGDPESGEGAARVIEDEVGDLLFAVVNAARLVGAHPSVALSAATAKFERRFARLVELAEQDGRDMRSSSLAELDALWERAKRMLG